MKAVEITYERIGAATTLSLRALIEFASNKIEQRFKHVGRIFPMWHAETESETLIIVADMGDKDATSVALTKLFREQGVIRYMFINEAWIVERTTDIAPSEWQNMQQHGLSEHPDRREVVMINAEDKNEALVAVREIIRPAKGKARLGPLVFDDYSSMEGRWTGLLAHLNIQTKLH